MICSGGEDGTVRQWNPKTGQCRHVFTQVRGGSCLTCWFLCALYLHAPLCCVILVELVAQPCGHRYAWSMIYLRVLVLIYIRCVRSFDCGFTVRYHLTHLPSCRCTTTVCGSAANVSRV
jgi:hypothetical protein